MKKKVFRERRKDDYKVILGGPSFTFTVDDLDTVEEIKPIKEKPKKKGAKHGNNTTNSNN